MSGDQIAWFCGGIFLAYMGGLAWGLTVKFIQQLGSNA